MSENPIVNVHELPVNRIKEYLCDLMLDKERIESQISLLKNELNTRTFLQNQQTPVQEAANNS